MRKHIGVLVLVLCTGACEVQNDLDGHFAVLNSSGHNIQLVVAGKRIDGVIPAGQPAYVSGTFSAPQATGSTTGITYEKATVVVSAYDLIYNSVMATASCTAGPNTVTNVIYRVSGTAPYEYPYIECSESVTQRYHMVIDTAGNIKK